MAPDRVFLSRLLLDMRSRQVISELASPYEMHRTLMRAFPATDDLGGARAAYGVLFRAESDLKDRVCRVYVQSNVEPDWDVLIDAGYYSASGTSAVDFECKEITGSLQKVRRGQVLAFRLRANPTRRVGREGDPLKGKRVELQREQDQITWLQGKGSGDREGVPGGFELVARREMGAGEDAALLWHLKVQCEGKVKGKKGTPAGGHSTTHLSVLFDGVLRITDVDAFLHTVRDGIGAGKAYGFGLLSLAPMRVGSVKDR